METLSDKPILMDAENRAAQIHYWDIRIAQSQKALDYATRQLGRAVLQGHEQLPFPAELDS